MTNKPWPFITSPLSRGPWNVNLRGFRPKLTCLQRCRRRDGQDRTGKKKVRTGQFFFRKPRTGRRRAAATGFEPRIPCPGGKNLTTILKIKCEAAAQDGNISGFFVIKSANPRATAEKNRNQSTDPPHVSIARDFAALLLVCGAPPPVSPRQARTQDTGQDEDGPKA